MTIGRSKQSNDILKIYLPMDIRTLVTNFRWATTANCIKPNTSTLSEEPSGLGWELYKNVYEKRRGCLLRH